MCTHATTVSPLSNATDIQQQEWQYVAQSTDGRSQAYFMVCAAAQLAGCKAFAEGTGIRHAYKPYPCLDLMGEVPRWALVSGGSSQPSLCLTLCGR